MGENKVSKVKIDERKNKRHERKRKESMIIESIR